MSASDMVRVGIRNSWPSGLRAAHSTMSSPLSKESHRAITKSSNYVVPLMTVVSRYTPLNVICSYIKHGCILSIDWSILCHTLKDNKSVTRMWQRYLKGFSQSEVLVAILDVRLRCLLQIWLQVLVGTCVPSLSFKAIVVSEKILHKTDNRQ